VLIFGAFQALEITGAIAVIGLGAFLSQGALIALHETHPLVFRAVLGLVLGAGAAFVVMILLTDMVSDSIEAAGRPLLIALVAVLAVLALLVVIRKGLSTRL
jgi:predicted lysophospholipase L1 biosynthesis ABC-type transport system permease subunit